MSIKDNGIYKDKSKVLELFNGRKKQAEKHRSSYEDKWVDMLQLYHGQMDIANYKYRSKLTMPMIWEKTETIVPRWMSGIVAGKSFFGLKGRTSRDRVAAERMMKIQEYQMEKEVRYTSYLNPLLRAVALYGTMLRVIDWRVDISSITGKTLYEGLGNRTIGIYDWWPDPDGFTLDEMKYLFIKDQITLAEVEYWVEKGVFDGDAFLKLKESGNSSSRTDDTFEQRLKGIQNEKERSITVEGIKAGREIEIIEMWEDDWVVTKANGTDIILRSKPNPFKHGKKPAALYRAIAIEGEPYGKSPVEMIRFLNYELNDTRNAKMDARNIAINGMYIGRRGAGLIPEQFRTRPNGIIWTEDVNNDIKPLPFGNILNSTAFEEGQISNDADRAVGVYDPQRGAGPGELNRTATGITLVIKEGNYRFAEQIRQLQTEGVAREIELSYKLNQQFLSDEKMRKITDEAGDLSKTTDLIQGDYDVIVTSSPHLGQREIEQQQLLQVYPVLMGNPYIDTYILTKKFVETFAEVKGLDDALKQRPAPVAPAPSGLPPAGGLPAGLPAPMGQSPMAVGQVGQSASTGNILAQALGARPNKGGWANR
ncbi:MAG: hypothetical protein QME51_00805 [Planctomycetota bacterium]|nr:hypothetical protein [Planctomycetota bacterium]